MQKIIVGNWKMHGNAALAKTLAVDVAGQAAKSSAQVILCPPFTLIAQLNWLISGSNLALGGQDCSPQPEGAYTGDISAQMLKDAGCKYVIIGHSERRQYHHESNEKVRLKAEQAIKTGLIPILCIGENAEERKSGKAIDNVCQQLRQCLPKGDFLLAYEPVWAIGSGRTPTLDEIGQMHAAITAVTPAPVLYGGSVNAGNAKDIMAVDGVAGVLVGGASLKAEEFCKIIASAI